MLIDCENNVVGMYTCMTQLGHTYLKSCCLDIILQQNGRSVDKKTQLVMFRNVYLSKE